ncbi:putative oxidoreductase TDA3 [Impatiens glandulifera]|uniref:putative oxidoreductase TDA3 n=1 Tax=Impatiens glandulifera TaxID=253017 RepID=UPI001FB09C42|nr:putative oxidoreductase TDA3 [Impatiens glandulifera]
MMTSFSFFVFPPLSQSPVSSKTQIVQTRRTIMAALSAENNSIDLPQKPNHRVVVCGGGVIGVCSAYFLAKRGAAVTLIEKSSVACAASGKAGGFLALDWCDDSPLSSLARASFNLHRSLSQELNGPQSYGYRALTTLSLSIHESDPKSKSKSNSSIIPSWIDGTARNCREIGSTETTAQVHPQLFARTLISKAVADYGVEIVIGKVENVRVEEGKATAVEMEGGRKIEADAVVLALGPWTGKLSLLSSIFRVYGIKAHSIVLEPKEAEAISAHALFLSYHRSEGGPPLDPEIYPRPKGEVYICGMSSEVEVPDDPEQITGDPESIAMLKRVGLKVSSRLGEGKAVVKAEQACFLPSSEDGIPVIGEVPGVNGCYVATGHSCWGILNGPATGAAMAELVMDGQASIVDLGPFSPARFAEGRRR